MIKRLLKSVREFKKDALLTPFFVVLEVVMEVIIPLVMALLIDKEVTFSALRDIAFAAERKLLKRVSLFDVYEGDKLPEGKKSYALSFVLEDKTQTLTDKMIEQAMANLTAQFERKAGAQVRA